jgi:uncharacterized protein
MDESSRPSGDACADAGTPLGCMAVTAPQQWGVGAPPGAAALPWDQMPDSPPSQHRVGGTIVVPGTGRVSVVPDVADLRLGVAVARTKVDAARSEAARVMDAILEAVDGAGVPRRDVRTTLLSIQPRYDYREGRPPILTGYELANVVEVTIRDLARLGDAVDAALAAGATSMDGLTLRLADPAPAEREARRLAMADARSRADVLATEGGLEIDGVADVVEGGPPRPPIPFPKAERMMVAADAATPVEAGELEVVVSVTVTFRAR